MKPTSLLPLAILLFPSSALATPPPELQDALSAASAAHTPLAIPAGLESRMVRRRASDKKLDDEAERLKERLGGVGILPPGHFNHTVSFNGTKYNGATMAPSTIPARHRRMKRNFWEKLEGHFGFGPSATASAEATKGTGVVDKGKAQSDDGRHYWYVEDSDDQKHWREKDGKDDDDVEEKKDDDKKVKRDVGDFFENIASEVNADGATSDVASATSSIASKISSAASAASSAASSTSSAAAAATSAAAAAASGNSTDAVWYNPTTWDDAISAEYRETKHKISELSVLSKVGLAVLVLVASVLLFALIYCACKLNSRRRRRNAAERAQLNLAAATSAGSSRGGSSRGTPGSGRGQRSFETGRDTSIPVMSYVGSSASTSSSSSPLDKGKAKAGTPGTKEKKGKGWSLLSRD
ncbi:hypothetical protein JCM9279_002409 [Rhodotorula babjevae]